VEILEISPANYLLEGVPCDSEDKLCEFLNHQNFHPDLSRFGGDNGTSGMTTNTDHRYYRY
jgi:hypothetical protein